VIALKILIGLTLILAGRKLFWLFVSAMGFIVAVEMVVRLFPGPDARATTLVALIAGLVAGVIGALLAVFLQRAAIGVVGFLAGGYIVLNMLDLVGLGEMTPVVWGLAFIGAIVGLILALSLLEWALIVLSSLSGASLIARSLDLSRPLTWGVLVVALVVGIVIQAGMLRKETA
jgi:hypothetical protein